MKKVKKFLLRAVTFAICGAVCFSAFACAKPKENKPEEKVTKATFTGTHVLTAPDSESEWLVKDGKTDYVLIIPETASTFCKEAKDEFVHLFKKATGITVSFQTDDVPLAANAKFISLGLTKQFKENTAVNNEEVYNPAKLEIYGVRLVTNGNNVYLLSGKENGLVRAVYKFMELHFGFDSFYRNCMYIDTDVKNEKLKLFDVTDIPDISMAIADNRHYMYKNPIGTDSLAGMTAQDTKNERARLGFAEARGEFMLPIIDQGYYAFDHSCMHYLPSNEDFTHWFEDGVDRSWKWISTLGDNLCYNARGDEVALEGLVNQCADMIERSLVLFPAADYPNRNTVSLTQSDGIPFCDCPSCAAHNKEDGDAPVGSIIRFVNRVRAKVGEWMNKPENEPYRRDELTIVFFAYNQSIKAPVAVDEETGEYKLVNDSVKMDKGTGVYYAANLDYCYAKDIYEEVNKEGRENLARWSYLTDYVWMWTYGAFYQCSVFMDDTINYFNNDAYRYMAAHGVKHLFNESQDYGDGATGWAALKDYLGGKLAWDVNADIDALTQKFFDNMYGNASSAMYDAYMAQRLYYSTMLEKNGFNDSMNYYNGSRLANKTQYFPLNILESFVANFDKALAAIETYRTIDEDLYTVYKSRIEQETAGTLAIIINLYGQGQVDSTALAAYKSRLLEICTWYPELKYTSGNAQNIINMVQ